MSDQAQAPETQAPEVAKKPRKQRADKGKPRGPRKPKTEAAQ